MKRIKQGRGKQVLEVAGYTSVQGTREDLTEKIILV